MNSMKKKMFILNIIKFSKKLADFVLEPTRNDRKIYRLRYISVLVAANCFWITGLLTAAGAESETSEKPEAVRGLMSLITDISSDSLDFDIKKRRAVFIGNVVIEDERVQLNSDKMIVEFDDNDQLSMIEAEGNVSIIAEGNKATGGKAVYDFVKGTIVLSENPVLIKGLSQIEDANEIIYERQETKFRTDGGRPHIIFFSDDEKTSLDSIFNKLEKEED